MGVNSQVDSTVEEKSEKKKKHYHDIPGGGGGGGVGDYKPSTTLMVVPLIFQHMFLISLLLNKCQRGDC